MLNWNFTWRQYKDLLSESQWRYEDEAFSLNIYLHVTVVIIGEYIQIQQDEGKLCVHAYSFLLHYYLVRSSFTIHGDVQILLHRTTNEIQSYVRSIFTSRLFFSHLWWKKFLKSCIWNRKSKKLRVTQRPRGAFCLWVQFRPRSAFVCTWWCNHAQAQWWHMN